MRIAVTHCRGVKRLPTCAPAVIDHCRGEVRPRVRGTLPTGLGAVRATHSRYQSHHQCARRTIIVRIAPAPAHSRPATARRSLATVTFSAHRSTRLTLSRRVGPHRGCLSCLSSAAQVCDDVRPRARVAVLVAQQ